jgi:hypothetical protein
MTAKAKLAGNTLVYGNRKQPDMKWDISTPELRAKAFLELFNYLKKEWVVYSCDYWGKTKLEQENQKALYKLASGDSPRAAQAAEELLTMRIDYEYENWRIVDVPKSGDGEPKVVLSKKPGTVFVKDIRRQSDSGRYSFQLSNGEEIEFAYLPISTTRNDWSNGHIVPHFLVDSFYEKLGRDRDFEKKVTEILSHMNYMRMTLYYTMYPERMPLGKNLAAWQRRAIGSAEGFIEDLGENPVEKLSERTVRPTNIQKAQDTVSELVLHYEGLLSHIRRLVAKKATVEEFEQYTLPSYSKKLEEIKKGIVAEL